MATRWCWFHTAYCLLNAASSVLSLETGFTAKIDSYFSIRFCASLPRAYKKLKNKEGSYAGQVNPPKNNNVMRDHVSDVSLYGLDMEIPSLHESNVKLLYILESRLISCRHVFPFPEEK